MEELCLNIADPPIAKFDGIKQLVTSPDAIMKLYLETYQKRLEHREMKFEYMDIYFSYLNYESQEWKL